jgi:hypothetical protein
MSVMKHERRTRSKSKTTGAKRKQASSRTASTAGKGGRASSGGQAGATRKKGPATRRRGPQPPRSDESALALRRAAGRKRAPTLEEVADVHSHTTEPDER